MKDHRYSKFHLRSVPFRLKKLSLLAISSKITLIIIGFSCIALVSIVHYNYSNGSIPSSDTIFTCPTNRLQVKSKNDSISSLSDFYDETNKDHTIQSIRESTVKEIESQTYDGWTTSYTHRKKTYYDWKAKYFGQYLKSGDSIYESACGGGYNLAMTLQIIQETKGIHDISVYGNDYIEKSAIVAPEVLKKLMPKGTKIKSICQADSTNLEFVPSNSFDLAYTGYIDPLSDQYNILGGSDDFSELCEGAKNGDWAMAKLVEIDQKGQEEWFAKWVPELVRITKPGKPIIIEDVALPQCDLVTDWGGVSKEWWKSSVVKYGWDVNVSSIVTEPKVADVINGRYNVFMIKN